MTDNDSNMTGAGRLPYLGHPDDHFEAWLADEYEPDDWPLCWPVEYSREDMMNAFRSGFYLAGSMMSKAVGRLTEDKADG